MTVCHKYTPREDLAKFAKLADILVVCTGKPCLITAEMVKPGAVVVDVGINEIVGECESQCVSEFVRASEFECE